MSSCNTYEDESHSRGTKSGSCGTPTNDAEDSFWQADLDEAAGRLADILAEEAASVLTVRLALRVAGTRVGQEMQIARA